MGHGETIETKFKKRYIVKIMIIISNKKSVFYKL